MLVSPLTNPYCFEVMLDYLDTVLNVVLHSFNGLIKLLRGFKALISGVISNSDKTAVV